MILGASAFLQSQGEAVDTPVIYQDNQSTIALINRGKSPSSRSKHIHVRYFWLKERIQNGELTITYCPTDDMVADLLTKPLQGSKFLKFREQLLNWSF